MHFGSAVLIGTLGGDVSSRVPTILQSLAPVGTPCERSHPTDWSGPSGERQSVCVPVGVLRGFPESAPKDGAFIHNIPLHRMLTKECCR